MKEVRPSRKKSPLKEMKQMRVASLVTRAEQEMRDVAQPLAFTRPERHPLPEMEQPTIAKKQGGGDVPAAAYLGSPRVTRADQQGETRLGRVHWTEWTVMPRGAGRVGLGFGPRPRKKWPKGEKSGGGLAAHNLSDQGNRRITTSAFSSDRIAWTNHRGSGQSEELEFWFPLQSSIT
ncbi:unnamed protein product [Linum trigynum]|uniref:Uncharacterized protein n=1 Tax=Linum trigynum TaxID=586398 RepID=A0AAV2DE76_9ROSI